MRLRKLNEEVWLADGPIARLSSTDIESLKRQAAGNARGRVRICAHGEASERTHEMLIVHVRGAYVRPHKHLGKSESLHVLEGNVDLVLFDDEGGVTESVCMGIAGSGRPFFFRIGAPIYHTLLIRSDYLVFLETTGGPFRREDTVFPAWAPEETDQLGRAQLERRLAAAIGP